jgi:hypothetical protein
MEKKDNFLDYIAMQNCSWDKDGKGHVYLIKEKTRNKLLKKIIGWIGRSQEFHIHLDDLGSAAWLAADGRRTILEIAAAMNVSCAAAVEQAEGRMARFFAMLARDKFVVLKSRDSAQGNGIG